MTTKNNKRLEFERLLARHGEHGIQAIIEKIERIEGVRQSHPLLLEDRWSALMSIPTQSITV